MRRVRRCQDGPNNMSMELPLISTAATDADAGYGCHDVLDED
ncbi:MAG TPA: hypothetical protein VFU73_09900 [Actinocrinis sp.]|nr:hypothetical protein [Actinocrinis sp.]